VSKYWWS